MTCVLIWRDHTNEQSEVPPTYSWCSPIDQYVPVYEDHFFAYHVFLGINFQIVYEQKKKNDCKTKNYFFLSLAKL